VLGGIVGLSIGYLALLWIGGPDKDFVKLGDKLPGWMLPASFQKSKLAKNQSIAPAPAPGPSSEDDVRINVPDLDPSADNAASNLPTDDQAGTDSTELTPFDDPAKSAAEQPAT